jgi:DNA-binding MarR family transcriptional regulator
MAKRKHPTVAPETFGGFTLDDLRKVVAEQASESEEADEPAYTTSDIRDMLDLSLHSTNKLIDYLIAQGKMRTVWRLRKQRDGIMRRRQCYQFID